MTPAETDATKPIEHKQQNIEPKQAKKMYLRGTFNLWGFETQYQLQQVRRNIYSAAATLVKKQTYGFMFSAKDSSKKYANCGYFDSKDEVITLRENVRASCNDIVLQNFKFTPNSNGVYEFFINLTNRDKPRVYLKKAY
jgi:hypothetical protein